MHWLLSYSFELNNCHHDGCHRKVMVCILSCSKISSPSLRAGTVEFQIRDELLVEVCKTDRNIVTELSGACVKPPHDSIET